MTSVVRTVVRVAALAAFTAGPGAALAGLVRGVATIVVSCVVALVAVVLFDHLGRRGSGHRVVVRWWLVGVAIVGAGVVAVLATAAAPVSGATPGVLSATVDVLLHGWSATITSPVPADASPRVLVPIAVVVWLAGAAAALIAGRVDPPRNPGRPPNPAAALLAPTVGFVVACVAAGREQFSPVWSGVAMAATAAVFLATFRIGSPARADVLVRVAGAGPGARSRSPVTPAAATVAAAIAVAVVGAALLGPRLTFGRQANPFDPRDRIDPPTVPSGAISPLDLFASRRRAADEPMFVIDALEPVLTRLVALDHYDGARWTSGAAYRPSGTTIVAPAREGLNGRRVSAGILIDGLTGPWLPSIADPIRVEGVAFLFEPAAGSLLAARGDVAGAEYRIEAELAAADVTALQALPVAADAEAIAALHVPDGMPESLREMATVATAGANSPFVHAALLQRYLQLSFERDEGFTAGHSYGHLVRSLTEVGAATDEQFASAFALMGRVVGLPTRVVVGFGPGERRGDGAFQVRGRDARAWPEVKFAGVGWIPFDPTPARDDLASVEVPIGPGGGTGFVIEEADAIVPIESSPLPASPDSAPGAGWGAIAGTFAAIAALVSAVVASTIVAKRSRTRRRRTDGTPTERVVGVWSDVLERLGEIDGVDPRGRTVDELVDSNATTSVALTGMYRPVCRALYDTTACGEADAEQAWRARDRFVGTARRNVGTLRRAVWAADPRPLVMPARRVHRPANRHDTTRSTT